MSVVEIKPPNTRHTLKRRPAQSYLFSVSVNGKRTCNHPRLIISDRRSKVLCEDCDVELDPLEALHIISDRIWWTENVRERQLEYDEKRVSKVQSAAIAHLYDAGITPEKYAVRWEKERERRNIPEVKPVDKATVVETKQDGCA